MIKNTHFKPKKTPSKFLILLTAVVVGLLSACNMPAVPEIRSLLATPTATAAATPQDTPTPRPPLQVAGADQATPLAPLSYTEIQFRVEIPANSPADSQVYLSLLDEVTGLALNAHHYTMQADSNPGPNGLRRYSLTLPFALGSLVTYRYERQQDGVTVAEHLSNDSPVRYRIFHVTDPGGVDDVVSAWTDVPFNEPSGRIEGRVFSDGAGVPNLLVSAGGAQALTASGGRFLIEGLPPGVHNLVVMAQDGRYHTFQQGALVAADSTTPAEIEVQPAEMVNVIFVVSLPAETPPIVPVRLAGSLYTLGNTFSSLTGGMSSLASNMPVLTSLPDGRYTLSIQLPSGADIRYKYTLGDGFWNAEHTPDGAFRLRQLVVPDHPVLVEDVVDTWRSGSNGVLTFDMTAPEGTPPGDIITLQLNPVFGWTEPIPMWRLDANRWGYMLFSTLDLPGELHYRYCRNGQCGLADDAETAGPNHAGRPVTIESEPQSLTDIVQAWANYQPGAELVVTPTLTITQRTEDFVMGVELAPAYHPSWRARLPNWMTEVHELGANWLVLTPTWTFTRQSPPVLEALPGQDESWFDLTETLALSSGNSLQTAIFPTPHFPTSPAEWWLEAERDFSWWLVWFSHYRDFILHHADLAQQGGASTLILGGDWLDPALPGGLVGPDQPSNAPGDTEQRWRDLIAEVRSRFNGQVYWAIADNRLQDAPPFLDEVDGIYLLWSSALDPTTNPQPLEMAERAATRLDRDVLPLVTELDLPVVIAAAYPAADGAVTGCLPTRENTCVKPNTLLPTGPDYPEVALDPQEQADVYSAMLAAVNQRDWIGGFVSRGFYPPAALQDKSISTHAKPAGEILRFWFHAFAPQ